MKSAFDIGDAVRPVLGLRYDLPGEMLPDGGLLTCHNWVQRNGALEKVGGWKNVGKVQGAVSLIVSLTTASGATGALICTNANIYVYVPGGAPQKVNTAAFAAPPGTRWEVDYNAGKLWFTNPIDGCWSWDGVNQMAKVASGSAPAAHIAQYTSHILLANLSTNDDAGPATVAGSDDMNSPAVADAFWDDADPNSEADTFQVPQRSQPGVRTGIQRLVRSGDGLCEIYKADTISNLQYIQLPEVYNQWVADPAHGLAAPAGLVDMGDARRFVSDDNFRSFDGGGTESFGDAVWPLFLSLLGGNDIAGTWAFWDRRNQFQQLLFGFASAAGGGGNDTAAVWSSRDKVWLTRDWPFTAAAYFPIGAGGGGDTEEDQTKPFDDNALAPAQQGAIDQSAILAGDALGNLWLLDETTPQGNGKDLMATIQTGPMAHGYPQRHKLVNRLYLDVPALTGSALQVYVGSQPALSAPVAWQGPYSYRPGQEAVGCMARGKFLSYKLVKTDGACTVRALAPNVAVAGLF